MQMAALKLFSGIKVLYVDHVALIINTCSSIWWCCVYRFILLSRKIGFWHRFVFDFVIVLSISFKLPSAMVIIATKSNKLQI